MITVENIIAFAAALWALASVVVAITPTKTDDQALGALRSFAERLSFFQPKNSPGVVSLPGKPAARPFPPYTDADELGPEVDS